MARAGSNIKSATSLLLLMLSFVRPAIAECASQNPTSSLGPLSLRSQSPGQALRLTPIARSAEVLSPGAREFRLRETVASIYAEDTDYHLDFHLADHHAAVAVGLGNCWDLELAWGERAIVNAYLDDITLTFHRWFGYSNSGQDEADRNGTTIDFPEYGVQYSEEDRGVFSRSAALTLTRQIRSRNPQHPALAASLLIRHELLERSEDGTATDVGLGLAIGQRIGNDYLHANFDYVWFGSTRYIGLPLKKSQFSAMLAYEWQRSTSLSLVGQYLYSQGVMERLGGLSEPSRELHLGAKWRFRGALLEAALIENVITYNNSPDFGFSLGLVVPF